MKQLRIVADDFGLAPGINRALRECAEKNVITAVSAMTTGPAFDELKGFINDFPHIEAGLHIDLVSEKLLTDLKINMSPGALFLKTIVDKNFVRLIEKEIRAQLEKFLKIAHPAHIDSHRHLHFIPAVFKITHQIADEFAINRVRIPVPKLNKKSLKFCFHRKDFYKFFPFFIWKFINQSCASSSDDFFGLFHSGTLTREYLDFVVKADYEYAELMVHPGYVDDILKLQNENLLYKREKELKLLLEYFL